MADKIKLLNKNISVLADEWLKIGRNLKKRAKIIFFFFFLAMLYFALYYAFNNASHASPRCAPGRLLFLALLIFQFKLQTHSNFSHIQTTGEMFEFF